MAWIKLAVLGFLFCAVEGRNARHNLLEDVIEELLEEELLNEQNDPGVVIDKSDKNFKMCWAANINCHHCSQCGPNKSGGWCVTDLVNQPGPQCLCNYGWTGKNAKYIPDTDISYHATGWGRNRLRADWCGVPCHYTYDVKNQTCVDHCFLNPNDLPCFCQKNPTHSKCYCHLNPTGLDCLCQKNPSDPRCYCHLDPNGLDCFCQNNPSDPKCYCHLNPTGMDCLCQKIPSEPLCYCHLNPTGMDCFCRKNPSDPKCYCHLDPTGMDCFCQENPSDPKCYCHLDPTGMDCFCQKNPSDPKCYCHLDPTGMDCFCQKNPSDPKCYCHLDPTGMDCFCQKNPSDPKCYCHLDPTGLDCLCLKNPSDPKCYCHLDPNGDKCYCQKNPNDLVRCYCVINQCAPCHKDCGKYNGRCVQVNHKHDERCLCCRGWSGPNSEWSDKFGTYVADFCNKECQWLGKENPTCKKRDDDVKPCNPKCNKENNGKCLPNGRCECCRDWTGPNPEFNTDKEPKVIADYCDVYCPFTKDTHRKNLCIEPDYVDRRRDAGHKISKFVIN